MEGILYEKLNASYACNGSQKIRRLKRTQYYREENKFLLSNAVYWVKKVAEKTKYLSEKILNIRFRLKHKGVTLFEKLFLPTGGVKMFRCLSLTCF